MDRFFDAVLERFRAGERDLMESRGDLAHAFTAACLGNEGEFKAYMRAVVAKDED
jgi:hypothetical protein